MKTAVSIPDPLFERAEQAARSLGISRSKLFQTALEHFLKARHDAAVTVAINASLVDVPATEEEEREDAVWRAYGQQNLKRVEWDE